MKSKILVYILTLFQMFTVACYAYSKQEEGFNKRRQFLHCIRAVTSHNSSNADALTAVAHLIDAYVEGTGEVKSMLEQCQALRNHSDDVFADRTLNLEVLLTLVRNGVSDRALLVIQGLYDSDVKCKIVSAQADATILIGGGAGMGFGVCKSVNGRRFLVTKLFMNADYGAGAAAFINYDNETAHFKRYQLADFDDDVGVWLGLVVAAKEDVKEILGDSKEHPTEPPANQDAYFDLGVGLGFAVYGQYSMKFELAPLPVNYKAMNRWMMSLK